MIGVSPDTDDGPPATVEGGDPEIRRVGIPVTAEGFIAADQLTDKAKARLARMLNDPAVSAKLGEPIGPTEIDPAITGVLYDAIGSLAASIAVATGHTVDSARLMAFTAEEKTALAQPTAKVLSKYSGTWAKWQDEIGLSLLLLAIMQGKIARLERKPADVRNFPAAVVSEDASS